MSNPNIGKECILCPGIICDDCGACETCDLDPTKRCDNCMRCLDMPDYNGVLIDKVHTAQSTRKKK